VLRHQPTTASAAACRGFIEPTAYNAAPSSVNRSLGSSARCVTARSLAGKVPSAISLTAEVLSQGEDFPARSRNRITGCRKSRTRTFPHLRSSRDHATAALIALDQPAVMKRDGAPVVPATIAAPLDVMTLSVPRCGGSLSRKWRLSPLVQTATLSVRPAILDSHEHGNFPSNSSKRRKCRCAR